MNFPVETSRLKDIVSVTSASNEQQHEAVRGVSTLPKGRSSAQPLGVRQDNYSVDFFVFEGKKSFTLSMYCISVKYSWKHVSNGNHLLIMMIAIFQNGSGCTCCTLYWPDLFSISSPDLSDSDPIPLIFTF